MRVLLFTTAYLPHIGGAELAVKEVTDRLSNIEFVMITTRLSRDLPATEKIANVTVHRIGLAWLGRLNKWLLPFLGLWHAKKLHAQQPFDCIHAIQATYGGQTASWFKRDHPDIPMLLTIQEGKTPEYYRRGTRFFHNSYKDIFRRADHVTVISHFLGDYAQSMGVEQNDITRIPNGVSFEMFARRRSEAARAVREHLTIPGDAFVVATASRLAPKNGVATLISAFAKMSRGKTRTRTQTNTERQQPTTDYRLLIAGDGDLRQQLEQQAKNLGIAENVFFLGTVPHDNLPEVLWAADAFVRLSRSEGLGNAFLEAMAAGTPVVGTPVGGIPDFLTDEKTGFVVPPDDPDAAAAALQRIYDDDPILHTVTEAARDIVRDEFNWNTIAQQYNDAYASLIQ